jgi:hypothetical protein
MQLRPYKSPVLGASPQQRSLMQRFTPHPFRVYTPQIGLGLGLDGTGSEDREGISETDLSLDFSELDHTQYLTLE